ILGTGIVGLALGSLGQHGLEIVEELLPLRPVAGGDDHLGGDAIKRGVVEDGRREVFGLETKLLFGVVAGDDDPGGDVAEFAGDLFFQHGIVFGLTAIAFGSGRAPADGLVRVNGTGDMDFVDQVVGDGVAADVGAAI